MILARQKLPEGALKMPKIGNTPWNKGIAYKSRRPLDERFWSKVTKTSNCWLWRGALSKNGYGVFRNERKNVYAHRLSYELFKKKITEGLVLDHLCRTRNCVRPDHLEEVTLGENVLRGEGITAQYARRHI